MVTKQKQAQIMALAKQTVEQGVGDNDLKRLQRQFDSSKSTFINIDQKQRFMKGMTVQGAVHSPLGGEVGGGVHVAHVLTTT